MRTLTPLLALALITACSPDADGDGVYAKVDCNDDDAAVFPHHAELCDGIDNDCDGQIDEQEDAVGGTVFFVDVDGDGFGDITGPLHACTAPSGYADKVGDCDDGDSAVNPDATEVCNDKDDDCDGEVDGANSSDADTWYLDYDSDSFGDPATPFTGCDRPNGFVADDTDCDDLWPEAYPGGTEVCDRHDNDCNGEIDEDAALDARDWYYDGDSDGYGDAAVSQFGCWPDAGYVDLNTDCDDTTDLANPGIADETCNDGLDNNCDGAAPECGLQGALSPSDGVQYNGANSSDYFGRSLAMLDLNGDGASDLVAGAYGNDDAASSAGAAYVFYGPLSGGSAGTADAAIYGEVSSNYVGYTVQTAGDVDGDGNDDLLVGGYVYSSSSGMAALYYGSSTALTGSLGISADADAYWTGTSSSDYLSHGLFKLGDLDDDGYDDFGIGAYGDDDGGSTSGSLFVLYGSATRLAGAYGPGDADAQFYGAASSGYVGYLNSTEGGDLDGDGYSDAVVGSYYSANAYLGGAYVLYGSASRWTGSSSIASAADASIAGTGSYDYFGRSVYTGDVDSDGYDDALVWEYYGPTSTDVGALWVFSGGASRLSGSYDAATLALGVGSGTATFDYFGQAAKVADLNDDGGADLIVGAGGTDVSASSAGSIYVFYGDFEGGAFGASTADATLEGASSSNYMGYYDLDAADVDGDAIDDLVAPAYGADSSRGTIYLFAGGGM